MSDVTVGEGGCEVRGSEGTNGSVPSSKVCNLGVERLCGGIIVRVLGFLHPYRYKQHRLGYMLRLLEMLSKQNYYHYLSLILINLS